MQDDAALTQASRPSVMQLRMPVGRRTYGAARSAEKVEPWLPPKVAHEKRRPTASFQQNASPNPTRIATHPSNQKRSTGAAAKHGPAVATSRFAKLARPLLVNEVFREDPIDVTTCALFANFCSGVTASVSMSGEGPLILATLCHWVRHLAEGPALVQVLAKLAELCMNDSIRVRISSAGGVGAVLRVLAEVQSIAVLCAACRLAKVLAKSEANRDAIAEVVPQLIALLMDTVHPCEEELQQELLALLKTLVKSDSALNRAVGLGLEILCVRLIQPDQAHMTRAAAVALFARLCAAPAASLEHALPLIEPIVLACAISSDSSFLRHALSALAQLAEHVEVRRLLAEGRGVATLCALAQRAEQPFRVRRRMTFRPVACGMQHETLPVECGPSAGCTVRHVCRTV
jgi:hypothetical protein